MRAVPTGRIATLALHHTPGMKLMAALTNYVINIRNCASNVVYINQQLIVFNSEAACVPTYLMHQLLKAMLAASAGSPYLNASRSGDQACPQRKVGSDFLRPKRHDFNPGFQLTDELRRILRGMTSQIQFAK